MLVGYLGTGTLTIRNGGSVSASTTSIASQVGSTGTLNIGAAAGQAAVAPGTLSTASVDFGDGIGQIVFNHTATNYVFAPTIASSGAGSGTVRVEAGTTILTATSTYTGATMVNGGTLSVNGSIAVGGDGECRRHARRQRHRRQHHHQRRHAGARQFDRHC